MFELMNWQGNLCTVRMRNQQKLRVFFLILLCYDFTCSLKANTLIVGFVYDSIVLSNWINPFNDLFYARNYTLFDILFSFNKCRFND